MPDFKVAKGYSAETSGGILTMLSAEAAPSFVQELAEEYGQTSWVVGRVTAGTRQARIATDAEIIPI